MVAGRVLFVEDEDSISEPFSELLRAEGFEPVIARTAADALALAEQIQPDVVLLDVMLPDGDGRDICRELRRRSDVPILMLTARADVTDRVLGLELGADDYVVKPFSAVEVLRRSRRRAATLPRPAEPRLAPAASPRLAPTTRELALGCGGNAWPDGRGCRSCSSTTPGADGP